MANFFEQFHDAPEQGAPAGTANYFSQFHPEDAGSVTPSGRIYVSPAKPKLPDNGVGDALVQGAKQGATAGFSDELQGLYAAGGGEEPDGPVVKGMKTVGKVIPGPIGTAAEFGDPIFHTLAGFAKYLAQDPEAHEKYNAAVLRERERIKAAEEHHAIAKGVGEVGGAIATLPMGGEASQAAAWTARAIAAAKQGAVYGGLQGAGEGEGAADTVKRAAAGTVLGGVVGGVAAPVVEGAGHVIKHATQKTRNAWRAATDAEAEASRQGAVAYIADRASDPNFSARMHPDEFRSNPEAMNIDLGGNATRRLADVAGIMSPGGEQKLQDAIGTKGRFGAQAGRFNDWFRSHFHYPDAYGQQQALDEVAKNVNRPAYRKAYQEGDRPIMSPTLETLMSSPKVVEAMKAASTSGKDRAVTEGYGAFNPAVKINDSGAVIFNKGKDGAPAFPNLQFWDQTRRELSQAAQKAQRSGANEDASVYGKLAQQLNAELDKHVPSYQAARQGAAGFFGADDALQAGIKYVSDSKVGLSEARATLAKMSPAERRLFQDGFVDEYLRAVINKTGDNRDVLLKIANNPEARGKLELVMGREKMQSLEAKIRVEQIFNQVREAIKGNSFTARRLVDMGLIGGQGVGALTGFDGVKDLNPTEIATGAIVGLLSRKGSAINANVASKVVDMMLSRDPGVWEKGFKLISSNPKWLGALRDADTKIGRVISGTAPTGTALQLTGAVRADDQKPGVERPVGR